MKPGIYRNQFGVTYLLDEVVRRKPAFCKVCKGDIMANEKAKVLTCEGICVGVYHDKCCKKIDAIK